jgi:hypothetical protein
LRACGASSAQPGVAPIVYKGRVGTLARREVVGSALPGLLAGVLSGLLGAAASSAPCSAVVSRWRFPRTPCACCSSSIW